MQSRCKVVMILLLVSLAWHYGAVADWSCPIGWTLSGGPFCTIPVPPDQEADAYCQLLGASTLEIQKVHYCITIATNDQSSATGGGGLPPPF